MPAELRRVLDIPTPRAVYATTFAPDGASFAYGGGCYHGEGFVTCRWLDGSPRAEAPGGLDLTMLTLSGLCFDAAGRHLVASFWAWPPSTRAPVHVFTAGNGTLATAAEFDCAGTGVTLGPRTLVVRRREPATYEDLLWTSPAPAGLATDGVPRHLTSARVAVVGDLAVTGFNEATVLDGVWEPPPAVVLKGPLGASCGVVALPSPHSSSADCAGRIGAVAVDAAGEKLLTCGEDGSTAEFQWRPGGLAPLDLVRLRTGAHAAPITAACFLAANGVHATADSRGCVRLWSGTACVAEAQIEALSVRALAAHPKRPLLAIGGKHPEGGPRAGRIVVVEPARRGDFVARRPPKIAFPPLP